MYLSPIDKWPEIAEACVGSLSGVKDSQDRGWATRGITLEDDSNTAFSKFCRGRSEVLGSQSMSGSGLQN
jgi:hypothetical protein